MRTGKLSQEAERVLKDIDRQMQSLPTFEAAHLKTQFNTLLDVSTCIIDREQFDPANLTQQEKKQLQNAAHALRQQVPVTDVSSKKKTAAATQPCIPQHSKHLTATLSAARC